MSSFPNDIRNHCLSPEQRAGSLGLGSSCRKWGLEPGQCSAGQAMLGFLGTWGVGREVLWERSLNLTMAGGRVEREEGWKGRGSAMGGKAPLQGEAEEAGCL